MEAHRYGHLRFYSLFCSDSTPPEKDRQASSTNKADRTTVCAYKSSRLQADAPISLKPRPLAVAE